MDERLLGDHRLRVRRLFVAVVLLAFVAAVLSTVATGRAEESADRAVEGGTGNPRLLPACMLRAEGAHITTVACLLEQTYEHPRHGDQPSVSITEWPEATGRRIRLVMTFEGRPTVGVQAQRIFRGIAKVEDGTSVWEARVLNGPGSIGAFTLNVSSVRFLTDGGDALFELHGTADVQLLPKIEGTATGVVNVRAWF